MGYIYILTNPSFPEWVKIGYADNVNKRVDEPNRSTATPFAFRVYATYEVGERLKDLSLHAMIDKLNPNLRSRDVIKGKERVREFFQMTKEDAYSLFIAIAEISCTQDKLRKYDETVQDLQEEEEAEEARQARHHFDTVRFSSSLTGKEYETSMGENGVLVLTDTVTGIEVPNFSKPSKKQIIRQALIDLGEEADNDLTLCQLAHTLIKIVKIKE